MDTDEYLRRFIDFNFELPDPKREEFCNYLYSSKFVGMERYINSHKGEIEGRELVNTFTELANLFGFSLHKIEQCYTEMMLALESLGINYIRLGFMVAFIVAIKNQSPEVYTLLCSKNFEDENYFNKGDARLEYFIGGRF